MEIGYLLIVLVVGFLYFLPTIIACLRGHRNKFGIFVLNLCLGGTGLGWVISLVWAVSNEK